MELRDHFVTDVDGYVGTWLCDSFIMETPHALSEFPNPLVTLKEPTARRALCLDEVCIAVLASLIFSLTHLEDSGSKFKSQDLPYALGYTHIIAVQLLKSVLSVTNAPMFLIFIFEHSQTVACVHSSANSCSV